MADLNEAVVNVTVEDSTIITVPIDTTLSIAGQAADAAAVGEALRNVRPQVTVDGQTSDAQGVVLLYASHIPVNGAQDAETVGDVLERVDGITGEGIPVNGETGAQTVAEAIAGLQGANGSTLPVSGESGAATIKAAIQALYPVGVIVATTSDTAPVFGFGTWAEVRITASWNELKTGGRSWEAGAGSGSVHFWRRTA
jgi:hypothetical protein